MPQIHNTLNTGQIVRKNAQCNVSPDAIKELNGFLETHLERATTRLCEIAATHKRKTIFAEDVIELFSFKNNGIIPEDD